MAKELTYGRLVITRKNLHDIKREIKDIDQFKRIIEGAIVITNQLIDLKQREEENGK